MLAYSLPQEPTSKRARSGVFKLRAWRQKSQKTRTGEVDPRAASNAKETTILRLQSIASLCVPLLLLFPRAPTPGTRAKQPTCSLSQSFGIAATIGGSIDRETLLTNAACSSWEEGMQNGRGRGRPGRLKAGPEPPPQWNPASSDSLRLPQARAASATCGWSKPCQVKYVLSSKLWVQQHEDLPNGKAMRRGLRSFSPRSLLRGLQPFRLLVGRTGAVCFDCEGSAQGRTVSR